MKKSPGSRTLPMSDPVEVVAVQAQIIAMQSETINDLFQLLMQHVAVEELDRLPCVERINRAAALRNSNSPGGRW